MGQDWLTIGVVVAPAKSAWRVYLGALTGLIDSLGQAQTAANLDGRLKVPTLPVPLGAIAPTPMPETARADNERRQIRPTNPL